MPTSDSRRRSAMGRAIYLAVRPATITQPCAHHATARARGAGPSFDDSFGHEVRAY